MRSGFGIAKIWRHDDRVFEVAPKEIFGEQAERVMIAVLEGWVFP